MYSYNPSGRDVFIQNILSDSNLTKLTNALQNNTNGVMLDNIENNISLMNNILLSAAKKSFPNKKLHTKRKLRKDKIGSILNV